MPKQKSWLERFAHAARWRLESKEAEEVITDYREIVGDPPRTEEELIRDLGRPRDAVKPLTDERTYRLWLAVFVVLAGCILAIGNSPMGTGAYLWLWLFKNRPYGVMLGWVVALLGVAGTIVWFRWKGKKGEKLSRAVPVLLGVSLVLIVGVLLFCWACARDFEGFLNMWGEMPALLGPERMVSRSMQLSLDVMCYSAPLLAVAGVFALVKARTEDRRWAAVYVLAMTAIMIALFTVALVTNMSIEGGPEQLCGQLLACCAVIAAIGLAGTGVALC